MCLGGIIGDIAGSIYEGPSRHPSRINFKLFPSNVYYTDDSVLLIATCDAILNAKDGNVLYGEYYRKYYRKYPYVGYGKGFKEWGKSDSIVGYGSYGNGAAMRSSVISFAFDTKEEVIEQAKLSAEVTHNHEEGIKGAQAIAYATFLARKQASKKEIRSAMEDEFGYNLLELNRGWSSSCEETVPNAIVAFLNSGSFVEAVRNGVMMGGDSDTIACMAGSIAQPYYGAKLTGIPPNVVAKAFQRLPAELAEVVVSFVIKYIDEDFVKPATMAKNAKLYDLFRSIFKE